MKISENSFVYRTIQVLPWPWGVAVAYHLSLFGAGNACPRPVAYLLFADVVGWLSKADGLIVRDRKFSQVHREKPAPPFDRRTSAAASWW